MAVKEHNLARKFLGPATLFLHFLFDAQLFIWIL
jgi:hypothetical protein